MSKFPTFFPANNLSKYALSLVIKGTYRYLLTPRLHQTKDFLVVFSKK